MTILQNLFPEKQLTIKLATKDGNWVKNIHFPFEKNGYQTHPYYVAASLLN